MTSSVTNTSTGTAAHLELGRLGEEFAAAYLQQTGFQIVAANFDIPIGRNRAGAVVNVEIDLVAYEGETLCFIEVKSRGSDWFAPPQVNVDRRKQRQIARAAHAYRRMLDLLHAPYRYDVITVVFPVEEQPAAGPEIVLLRNYWTDEKLRRHTSTPARLPRRGPRAWAERYWD